MELPAFEAQAVPGPGAMLRMARESRGMTIAEVAAGLKMSPRQIEAIESEDFSRLSGATFIRGFIRNYAKLLKIDVAPVLDALAENASLPQAELNAPVDVGVKMPTAGGRHGKGLLGATVLALGMLGLALVLYFDFIDLGMFLKHQNGQAASSRPAGEPQIVQLSPQPVVSSSATEGVIAEGKPLDSSEKPVPQPGMHRLVFSFDGSSWVEVKDASGRTIFSQMNARGTTQMVEGRPPFQLVVGNASHVRLQHNDLPVDLIPHTRVEVARLTLE